MERHYNWAWVESAVSAAIADWNNCAGAQVDRGPWFNPREQEGSEAAYDRALLAVEREAKRARLGARERQQAQRRIVAIFPRFASVALGLEDEAVRLLTDGFLAHWHAVCAVGEAIRSRLVHWRHDSGMPQCVDRLRHSAVARRRDADDAGDRWLQPVVPIQ